MASWRHGVSNRDCLFNNLFMLTTKNHRNTFQIVGPLRGKSTGDTGDQEFPSQKADNAEIISKSWLRHEKPISICTIYIQRKCFSFSGRHTYVIMLMMPDWLLLDTTISKCPMEIHGVCDIDFMIECFVVALGVFRGVIILCCTCLHRFSSTAAR